MIIFSCIVVGCYSIETLVFPPNSPSYINNILKFFIFFHFFTVVATSTRLEVNKTNNSIEQLTRERASPTLFWRSDSYKNLKLYPSNFVNHILNWGCVTPPPPTLNLKGDVKPTNTILLLTLPADPTKTKTKLKWNTTHKKNKNKLYINT